MITAQPPALALQDRVQLAIADSPYLSRRKLHLHTQDGRVTLRGTVSTYYQKQMAQETLRRIDGVEEIENLLEVNWNTQGA